jgi:hypothetical protein
VNRRAKSMGMTSSRNRASVPPGVDEPLDRSEDDDKEHLLFFCAEAEAALQIDLHRQERVGDLVARQALDGQKGRLVHIEARRRRRGVLRRLHGLPDRRRTCWRAAQSTRPHAMAPS